ncbi:thioesterase family protein [Grosmannia clavigera kw1407]|uniref:Thioesterase family protein n=1 Tax=Grosmannia clavigera (strain kw1407 / UAMH 11150) TaxID=655863 RepID=F0X9C3_GROCL|nr:thioesterase family protein [Grosmannia clavigera kw1407]EFX05669.1 thioesterase family protein [Grosmannia clavigera kw1407]
MFLQRTAATPLRPMLNTHFRIGLLQSLRQPERRHIHHLRPVRHAVVAGQTSFSSRVFSPSRRALSSSLASPSYDPQQQQRQHQQAPPPPPPPPSRSRFRRFVSLVIRGFFFTTVGYVLVVGHSTRPLWKDLDVASLFRTTNDTDPLSTKRPLSRAHAAELAYRPDSPEAAALEAYLADHPMWTDGHGRELIQVWHLGRGLCGHPGIVHGGFVATMLDEGLARCCFNALPMGVGMTAYLHVDYRAPTPADAFVVLHAKTVRVEGRKAWVQARLETLPPPSEDGKPAATPVVLAEAEALFVGFRDNGLGKFMRSLNT